VIKDGSIGTLNDPGEQARLAFLVVSRFLRAGGAGLAMRYDDGRATL
jgi:hypothetical protein